MSLTSVLDLCILTGTDRTVRLAKLTLELPSCSFFKDLMGPSHNFQFFGCGYFRAEVLLQPDAPQLWTLWLCLVRIRIL